MMSFSIMNVDVMCAPFSCVYFSFIAGLSVAYLAFFVL